MKLVDIDFGKYNNYLEMSDCVITEQIVTNKRYDIVLYRVYTQKLGNLCTLKHYVILQFVIYCFNHNITLDKINQFQFLDLPIRRFQLLIY